MDIYKRSLLELSNDHTILFLLNVSLICAKGKDLSRIFWIVDFSFFNSFFTIIFPFPIFKFYRINCFKSNVI